MTAIKHCKSMGPNGCGSEDISDFSKALVDFFVTDNVQECCNAHDICFGTCGSFFNECERQFKDCLNSVYKLLAWSTDAFGCSHFREAQEEICACRVPQAGVKKLDIPCPKTQEESQDVKKRRHLKRTFPKV